MPTFKYTAKDTGGKTVSATMEASDRKVVVKYLRDKNCVIVNIEEKEPAKRRLPLPFIHRKKVKTDDLIIFARQLATMVDAGISLMGAFDILGEQAETPHFKKVLLKVRDDIQTGSSLSESMSKEPSVFSTFFINMVRAGESSGALDEILDRVASYFEKTAGLMRRIKAALVYPAIVSIMAVAITALLLLKVVPVFEEIFTGFGAELPLPTQILINVSNILQQYFLLCVGLIILAAFLLAMHIRTDKGKLAFDRFMLRLPVFGKLVRKVAISKFTRTLASLTKSGVSILTALDIVSKTAGNKVVENAVNEVKKAIREGERIAGPLSQHKIFPPIVVRMIAVGEETGELEKMLSKISDFYDEQVDAAVTGLTSMIEPLIIAFLGIVIGGIVICMFMPIFKLTTIIQI